MLPICIASAVLLHFGRPLWTVLLAHVMGFGFASRLCLRLISRNLFKIQWPDVDWKSWWPLLKQSLPLAAATFLGLLYFRIGTILLSFMEGDKAVGWFGAAFHVNEGLQIVPAALMGASLPVLSRQFKTTCDSLDKTFKTMIYYLLMFAFPVAIGMTLLSREFSIGIFGPDFGNTAPVLRITIWALVPIFLNFAIGTLLIAVD